MSTDTHREELTTEELNAEDSLYSALSNRKRSYPNIEDQLDMLFHDIENGTLDNTGSFFTTLKAVKDDNPKS